MLYLKLRLLFKVSGVAELLNSELARTRSARATTNNWFQTNKKKGAEAPPISCVSDTGCRTRAPSYLPSTVPHIDSGA